MKDLVLSLPRRLEKIEHALSTLRKDVDGIKESDSGKLRERVAKVEVALKDLSDPLKRRMDRAEQTKYIITTIKQQLKRNNGTPDEADTLGNSVSPGGRDTGGVVRLGAAEIRE